jgi:hypothetical protein
MPLAFVKGKDMGGIFVYCHSCGSAWSKPTDPESDVWPDSLRAFAPAGAFLATYEELTANGLESFVNQEYGDDWDYIFSHCDLILKRSYNMTKLDPPRTGGR